MTAGCEATAFPEPAFCISDGGGSAARRRDPAAGHGFAEGWSEPGRCSFPASSILRSAAARLPGPVSHCCCRAPAASASCQCSSFVQLVFVQRCSWKCLRQLWHVGRGFPCASTAALLTWKRLSPLVLLHPGPALSQQLVLPVATSSPTRNRGASGSPGIKQTSLSTSATARGEREHCCHLLCCLTSFSQIRSGRSKEMVNSAHEFVCFLSWKVQARQGRTFPHCGYIRF